MFDNCSRIHKCAVRGVAAPPSAPSFQGMRDLPPSAEHQFGVFTRRQAFAAGWTRSALHHAVRTGGLLALRRGIFTPADVMAGTDYDAQRRHLATTAVAAVLATPAAVASHASAAVLANLPVWRMPRTPCITVPPRHTGDATSVHLHRAATPARHLRMAEGLIRTSAARTVCDLAREHGIADAVVAADAAMHAGILSADDLERCVRDCARWPGVRRAQAAITLIDGRAESPLESVSRLRLAALGVPSGELQSELISLDGAWLGRVDFYWDEYGVAGEVDGMLKYTDDGVLRQEKLRQERLETAGVIVVRWGQAQLRNAARLADRLYGAFARGQRRPASERGWLVRPSSGDFAP